MKRFSLIITIFLIIFTIILSCGSKSNNSSGGNEPTPTPSACNPIPWASLGKVQAPTIFTINGFDTIFGGNNPFAYINGNKCENIMSDAQNASSRDCFSDDGSKLVSKYAELKEVHSKVAIWTDANNSELYLAMRIQIDDNNTESVIKGYPNEAYQFYQYLSTFKISQAEQDPNTCEVSLMVDLADINSWNKGNMNEITGRVQDGSDGNATFSYHNPVKLIWNYDLNKLTIDTTFVNKDIQGIGYTQVRSRINASNGVKGIMPLANIMLPNPVNCASIKSIPWDKLGNSKNTPTIFKVTGFDFLYLDIISDIYPYYVNANNCQELLSRDGLKIDNPDCSNGRTERHANLVGNHSQAALWTDANNSEVYLAIRLQIDDNNGNSVIKLFPRERYQFYEFKTAFKVSEATSDLSSCKVTLKANRPNVYFMNRDYMDEATGLPKNSSSYLDKYSESTELVWDYASDTLDINVEKFREEIEVIIGIFERHHITTKIKTNNGIIKEEQLENRLLISK